MVVNVLYSPTSSEYIEGTSCEGAIEYQSYIKFTKEPKSLTVNHMKEKGSGDSRTKETIVTKSFE